MAYATDLRQRVLAASDGPLSNRQVAALFQVSTGTLERWRRPRREHGQLRARPSTGPTEYRPDRVPARPSTGPTEYRAAARDPA